MSSAMNRKAKILVVSCVFALVCVPSLATWESGTQARLSETYGRLPLRFEANHGQTDPQVDFISRGDRHVLFLTPLEAVLAFAPPPSRAEGSGAVLRMRFVGANPEPRVKGLEELPGKTNYFIGNDPALWRANVPTYGKVRYEGLYAGIDLIYYSHRGHLEYDFVVRSGADPSAIVLGFKGADRLEVTDQGDLVLHTGAGAVRQRKPVMYQEVDGVRKEIPGGYVLADKHQVRFRVAAYDTRQALVIDPILFYSTSLGGSGDDAGLRLAVDAAGNAYVTGSTNSSDFPTTAGAGQTTLASTGDAFVTKLNPTGSGIVYSTYLGGSGQEDGLGIAVDAAGNAYVTGLTDSSDFPTTAAAVQPTFAGVADAFVTKLDPTGSALVYSTTLGGSGFDRGFGIAVDASGNAYVMGLTNSVDFPTTAGAVQPTLAGGWFDAFVTKLNPTGSALVYSTFHGGDGFDCSFGIAVDAAGSAYVTGLTDSRNFPTTAGAFQTTIGGSSDAFVTKLNPAGSALVYSTYLGGSGQDEGLGIAVDRADSAYVTGRTGSANFPTTVGAFRTTIGGPGDAFVTKLNPAGSALVYSTAVGGSDFDRGFGIAVDAAGSAYVTGETFSSDFPTTAGAFQTTFAGVEDVFVTKVDPTGSALVYSTYLGGSGYDLGSGIAVDALPNANAYVAGLTASADFPTTPGAFQATFGGGVDAFVAKITDIVLPASPTIGKVSGGGAIEVTGGTGTFDFVVQRQTADGSIQGVLQYVNRASGTTVSSVTFDSLAITGDMVTVGGTCTRNGVSCTFTVRVTDSGESGTNDSFTIAVDADPPEGSTLRSGSIQIHQQSQRTDAAP
jgi:hypothetical protein